MGNHEWDDDRIEQLLSNAPKIRDERSKDEILARLKNDPRLSVPEKKKKRNRWIPASISAAAVVTLSILVSSFYNGNPSHEHTSQDQAKNDSQMQMKTSIEDPGQNSIMYNSSLDESTSEALEAEGTKQAHLAVYQKDLDAGFTAFHIGIASQAEPVPVTFLISNEKIAQDFGGADKHPTSVELYNKYASAIHETAYGFSDYHPMAGKFKEENDLIIHTLPKENLFDQGAASLSLYTNILNATFYGYNQVKIVNPDGSPAEFSEIGAVDPVQLKNGYFGKAYYSFTLEDGLKVMAPWYYADPNDVEAALNAMKESPSDLYQTVIPENIKFTVTEEKGLVRVKFTEPLDLLAMDPDAADRMIKGMQLTAASFTTPLQFENIVQKEWNGFNFTEPLPMPVGPNPFYLPN